MICFQRELQIDTRPDALHDITGELEAVVRASGVRLGLCCVFVRHTSASLVIQENADPSVQRDLRCWLGELAPEGRRWEHCAEGADDMPAHARAAITRSSESIPIAEGRLGLGTWQGVYLWEHRSRRHRRAVIVHVMGEG
jgi:secondary thiamine-phosphate synthase enzyme